MKAQLEVKDKAEGSYIGFVASDGKFISLSKCYASHDTAQAELNDGSWQSRLQKIGEQSAANT